MLFSDLVRSLAELIEYTEKLVAMFNVEATRKHNDTMDLEAIRQGAGKAVPQQTSYLVDMAKAEALDTMGEEQSALEILERYLSHDTEAGLNIYGAETAGRHVG